MAPDNKKRKSAEKSLRQALFILYYRLCEYIMSGNAACDGDYQANKSYSDAVISEDLEFVFLDKQIEQADSQYSYHSRNDYADKHRQKLQISALAFESIDKFYQIGAENRGDPHDEGKLSGGGFIQSQQESNGDGRTGAGNAGQCGYSLHNAHGQSDLPSDIPLLAVASCGVCGEEHKHAGDEEGESLHIQIVVGCSRLDRILDKIEEEQRYQRQQDHHDEIAVIGHIFKTEFSGENILYHLEKFKYQLADTVAVADEHRQQRA